ncbi:helix-turn-helix transcriptional regulator [Oceanobacillus jeddahense]|uniref:DeoR family transcriptional regulator n=1 Tax=Oceanobacillus jeddahense TaxID=1462527 RepID=A0ABY5JNR0_9BACI|nr:DeoR family transcriptional regulator [Oceanobacillus jeddahense]UUI01935.1 DeoR family transcriptional regulator [Oceanobacillus jeddahense]
MGKRISTKDKVIHVLKEQGTVTMDTLMEHFTISETAVRKQLHTLVQEGFIEVQQHKKEIGRPYHTYRLTEKSQESFPNRYKELSLDLLHDLEELQGSQLINELLKKQSTKEKEQLKKSLDACSTIEEKINTLKDLQNQSGYMFQVEDKGKEGFQLNNFHCPFLEVAKDYPVMCQHEKEMYEALLPNQEIKTKSLQVDGNKCCQWRIAAVSE